MAACKALLRIFRARGREENENVYTTMLEINQYPKIYQHSRDSMERIQNQTTMKQVTNCEWRWRTEENDQVYIKWTAAPHDILVLMDMVNNERYGVEWMG